LFAQLRDKSGVSEANVDLAADKENGVNAGATVHDVWRALVAAHPELAPFESSVSCAVNATYARKHTRVNAGDEVAFLPPVSGG
jgi:molybdopterin synthase sulfur carrier subunit